MASRSRSRPRPRGRTSAPVSASASGPVDQRLPATLEATADPSGAYSVAGTQTLPAPTLTVQPMPQSPPFKWTADRKRALVLLANGDMTKREIAKTLGISEAAFYAWVQHPEFKRRLEQLQEEQDERLKTYAIARKRKRLEFVQSRLNDIQQLIAERGVSSEFQEIPGGSTGMVGKRYKIIRMGSETKTLTEFFYDKPLQDAALALLEYAKDELGEAAEEHATVIRQYIGINIDRV